MRNTRSRFWWDLVAFVALGVAAVIRFRGQAAQEISLE
jgi:hypothetical protein